MPKHCKSIVRGVPDGSLKIPAEHAQIALLFGVSQERIDKYRRPGIQPKVDLTLEAATNDSWGTFVAAFQHGFLCAQTEQVLNSNTRYLRDHGGELSNDEYNNLVQSTANFQHFLTMSD
jgi:hypothetical protein